MKEHRLKNKLAFASADIFGGGSFNIVNFLYSYFLVVTVGISPFWAGFVMLFARVWDAVTDPIMGFISDKTKSRFGKRRIYLIFASPLVLISMYFLFFPYDFSEPFLKVTAVLLSYLVFTTVQTMVMIPYYSLSSEISSDYQVRASYNSYRLAFSIFSSILCVAVPGIIVNSFADATIGYQVMSLSFGFIFALSILFTGLFAKEEIITKPVVSKLSFKNLSKPLVLKPFRQYLLMFMMLQMTMAIMSGLYFFFVNFYVDRDTTASGGASMVGLIGAALMFSMQIVALPIYIKIIAKKGKTFAYRLGAVLWMFTAILLFMIPQNGNPLFVYLIGALMGLGISGPGLVPHAMYGDVVDAGELKFRTRLDGQMSGFTNFINKIAQGVGLSLVMWIIGFAGFIERQPGEDHVLTQPDSAMLAIRIILMLAPIILMGIGIFVSTKYKIDAKKQEEIKKMISSKESYSEEIIDTVLS
jgi:oligogalacturonide transporter